MKATIETSEGRIFQVDLNQPLDISLPLHVGSNNATAWYVGPVKMEPVIAEGFIGSVAQGGSVNFRNISFNPHGHGTHTECFGHIAQEVYSINQNLDRFFFTARLISVLPEKIGADEIISLEQIRKAWGEGTEKAIVIRTMPNPISKKGKQYSNSNPAYISREAALWIREQGIDHLLIDLPSVDREEDEGKLEGHRAFWDFPGPNPRKHATITEFIFVPNEIIDGSYLLNLQIAPFENDASPSKPVLYKVKE